MMKENCLCLNTEKEGEWLNHQRNPMVVTVNAMLSKGSRRKYLKIKPMDVTTIS